MPERASTSRRPPAKSAAKRSRRYRRRPPPPLRRKNPAATISILRRYSSEPVLRFISEVRDRDDCGGDLPRHFTCMDVLSPSLSSSSLPFLRSSPDSMEVKVVVSVTVEGSPGPVRAMVRLGSRVDDTIAAVVERYGREGRSPRIDREAAAGFQLHYSHFSLQSLNKSDKIGDIGGRSFYLRKTCDNGTEENQIATGGSEIELVEGCHPAIVPSNLFYSFIAKRLSKIRRRTRKLWTVVGCITCE